MNDKELVKAAIGAYEVAYMPYSGFAVDAMLLTVDEKLYQGCNIKNAAYTLGNCAECTAFFKAMSIGEWDFTTIATAGREHEAPISEYCVPCGVCRQVMMEFYDPDTFRISLAKSPEEWQLYMLKGLLPLGFSSKDLDR